MHNAKSFSHSEFAKLAPGAYYDMLHPFDDCEPFTEDSGVFFIQFYDEKPVFPPDTPVEYTYVIQLTNGKWGVCSFYENNVTLTFCPKGHPSNTLNFGVNGYWEKV